LWVPLLAGADRLGVLEVDVRTAADLHDPALREQCRWLAAQLGYLIAGMSRYGDDLARARGGGGRAPAAELLRGQLPPLTAATGSLVLAGAVEPGCYGGGDAFDYALSERTVSLGVFDAAGTGLRAGLGTAAALAGYRTARRAGAALADQVRAVDEVVADSSADGGPVSGVLAELDVPSGRLRYVTAGQPAPLLLRAGTVAEELGGGRRAPFGLPAGQPGVAEQVVRPGDWLVLHTDGVTGARDRSGGAFGAAGLVDFLRREAAADHPPAETVRRLAHAVRGHAGNALQDDATVLLASWRRGRSD